MLQWLSKRIMAKLVLQFLVAGLIPLVLLGGVTYYYSHKAVEAKAFRHLSTVNQSKKQQLSKFLQTGKANLELLSGSSLLLDRLKEANYTETTPLLAYFMDGFGYDNVFFLSNAGSLLHEVEKVRIPEDTLQQLSKRIKSADGPVMTDLLRNGGGQAALFMGAPVAGESSGRLGLLVFQVNAARINSLISDTAGMGETGETYLVGQDHRMRSKSRFFQEGALLHKEVRTEAVDLALKGGRGTSRIEDYRKKEVLSAYDRLNLREKFGANADWAIISEIDAAEALGLLNRLGFNVVGTAVVLMMLVGVMGYFQSRMIARPINTICDRVMALDKGDFTLQVPEEQTRRNDEIGVLSKTIASGVQRFRKQIENLGRSTKHLLSSTSQISTTASQLASSASETSSSISEVSTTVEEVQQTSQMAMEKAEKVYKSSEDTARISSAGKEATENTTAGINRIREEMNGIAESTVKLSEQTKSIEEIINTVSDIADQSNILSVNAAIEAAKAGEQGKGFAVVAREVKSLADQSKEATSQVRTILGNIQKDTSTAVMATERGTKTVEEAIELAEQSGMAIERLERQVNESSESASQIMASNQQQLSGMEQLSQAMESINEATQQNLQGVKELEEAIKGFEEFAQATQDIVSSYKV